MTSKHSNYLYMLILFVILANLYAIPFIFAIALATVSFFGTGKGIDSPIPIPITERLMYLIIAIICVVYIIGLFVVVYKLYYLKPSKLIIGIAIFYILLPTIVYIKKPNVFI